MCGAFWERWTRTQRIRTAAAIPVAAPIVEAGSTPVYLEIAAKAAHLRELGLSDRAIARAIGVTDKTVAKSLLRRHAHTSPDRPDDVGVDKEMAADIARESSADSGSRPR